MHRFHRAEMDCVRRGFVRLLLSVVRKREVCSGNFRFPNLRSLAGSLPCPCKNASSCIPTSGRKIQPERAARYLDVPNMSCQPSKFPGIEIKVLYTDDTGITTALFKLEPGAVVPLHEHTALEQTYVIEGSLEDHEGKCGPGQFVWRPAANQHEAVAPNGAVLLGFFLSQIVLPTARSSSPRQGSARALPHQRAAIFSSAKESGHRHHAEQFAFGAQDIAGNEMSAYDP